MTKMTGLAKRFLKAAPVCPRDARVAAAIDSSRVTHHVVGYPLLWLTGISWTRLRRDATSSASALSPPSSLSPSAALC
ncbi:hypothetical protein RMSM_07418 [Rhodopirellula maiorica SM1]|uniref:Uncharacterized protein n=1 Tax=Rhodopirellula maiorica SM1 TaxID=1265738 RepID=M5R844_9BACT|nr:hypothetical protein RMSM_07418 [Rhodopirellula maiorica SM1]